MNAAIVVVALALVLAVVVAVVFRRRAKRPSVVVTPRAERFARAAIVQTTGKDWAPDKLAWWLRLEEAPGLFDGWRLHIEFDPPGPADVELKCGRVRVLVAATSLPLTADLVIDHSGPHDGPAGFLVSTGGDA